MTDLRCYHTLDLPGAVTTPGMQPGVLHVAVPASPASRR